MMGWYGNTHFVNIIKSNERIYTCLSGFRIKPNAKTFYENRLLPVSQIFCVRSTDKIYPLLWLVATIPERYNVYLYQLTFIRPGELQGEWLLEKSKICRTILPYGCERTAEQGDLRLSDTLFATSSFNSASMALSDSTGLNSFWKCMYIAQCLVASGMAYLVCLRCKAVSLCRCGYNWLIGKS